MPILPPRDDPEQVPADSFFVLDPLEPVTMPVVPPMQSTQEQQAYLIGELSALNTRTHDLLQTHPSLEAVYQQQLAAVFGDLPTPINPNQIFYTRYRVQEQGAHQWLSSEPLGALLKRLREPGAEAYLTEETGAFYREARTLEPHKRLSATLPAATLVNALEVAFTLKLNEFWKGRKHHQPNAEQRLIALRRQVLAHQLALRTVDGTLSAAARALADNLLKYPTAATREEIFPAHQLPRAYRLTLADGSVFAAAFIMNVAAGPTLAGSVVLYSPGEGFEEFENLRSLNDTLAARLRGNEPAGELLASALPAAARAGLNGSCVLSSAPPLIETDVIADSVHSLRIRQYFNTRAALREETLPVTGELDRAADLTPQLDLSTALAARNLKLVAPREPAWLKAASPNDQRQYRQFETAMIDSNDELFPLLENISTLTAFSDDEVSKALKIRKPQWANVEVAPFKSLVKLRATSLLPIEVTGYRDEHADTVYISEDPQVDIPHALTGRTVTAGTWNTKTVVDLRTLGSYARRNVDPWSPHDAHRTITATADIFDHSGTKIGSLDNADLRALAQHADIGRTYDEYLRSAFSQRGEGRLFARAWQRANVAKMRKEALESRLNPAIADLFTFKTPGGGLDWVQAITQYPDSATRPKVGGFDIEVNLLVIGSELESGRGGQVINEVLVIQRKNTRAGGVCVLYTPGAPDNVPFRELVLGLVELDRLKATAAWRAYFTQRMATNDAQELARIFSDTRSANRYTLTLICGDFHTYLYSAQLGFQLAHADYRSRSNAQIAQESAINAFAFGVEVADFLLDLSMVKSVWTLLRRRIVSGIRRAQQLGRKVPGLLSKTGGDRVTHIALADTSIRPLEPLWVDVTGYRLPHSIDALFDVEQFSQTHHYSLSRSMGAPSFIDSRQNQFVAMKDAGGRYFLYPSYVEDGARYIKDPTGTKTDFMVVPADAKSWKPRFDRTTRGGGPVLSVLRPLTVEQQVDEDLIAALNVYSSPRESQHYPELLELLSAAKKQELLDQVRQTLNVDETTFRRIVAGQQDVHPAERLRHALLTLRLDVNTHSHLSRSADFLSGYRTFSAVEINSLFIKVKKIMGKNEDFSKIIRGSITLVNHDTGAQFVGYAFTQKQLNTLKKFNEKFHLSTWNVDTLNAFLNEKGSRSLIAKLVSDHNITPEEAVKHLLPDPKIQDALNQFRIKKRQALLKQLGVDDISDEFKKSGIPYIVLSFGETTDADSGLKAVDSIAVASFEKNIPQFSTPLEFSPPRVQTHRVDKPPATSTPPTLPPTPAPSVPAMNIVTVDELAETQLRLLPANAKTKVEEIIQDIQAGRVSRKKIGNYTYVDLPQLDEGTGRGRWRVAFEKTGKDGEQDTYALKGIIDYHGSRLKVWGI